MFLIPPIELLENPGCYTVGRHGKCYPTETATEAEKKAIKRYETALVRAVKQEEEEQRQANELLLGEIEWRKKKGIPIPQYILDYVADEQNTR